MRVAWVGCGYSAWPPRSGAGIAVRWAREPGRRGHGRARLDVRTRDRAIGPVTELEGSGGPMLPPPSPPGYGVTAGSAPGIVGADVGLSRCFSNPRRAVSSLIPCVRKGSRRRRPRSKSTERVDQRGPVVGESRQSQTRLNASNRASLLDSYAAGVPVQELADRFGVHRSTVSELVRRAGVPARSPGLPESIRREAARLYEGGLTLPQVAARLGISNDGARSGIVSCGGTIRPRGRRRVVEA